MKIEFGECSGCGGATAPIEHKPARLCEDCIGVALWAEAGDLVMYQGAIGTVLVYPDEQITVLAGGRIHHWPTAECARLAYPPEEPIVPERRTPCTDSPCS